MPGDLDNPTILSEHAKSLLENEVFNRVVKHLKESYVKTLAGTPVGAPEVVDLHANIRALDGIVFELRNISNSGAMPAKRR